MNQIKKRFLSVLAAVALCAGLLPGSAGALPPSAGAYHPTFAAENVGLGSSAGYYMVIDADGGLWAWGTNRCGGLGIPGIDDGEEVTTPTKLMDGAASVVTGFLSTYVVKQDGSLWGWGRNIDGEMGFGEFSSSSLRYQPEEVYEPTQLIAGGVRAVSSDSGSTLILMQDGRLLGCGSNLRYRLGQDNQSRSYAEFVEIMDGVRDVCVDRNATCVIKNDGSLWVFGDRLNLFGLPKNEHGPTKIMDGVAAAAFGSDLLCVLKIDGTLWTYANYIDNSAGERQRPEGTPVQTAQGVTAVAACAGTIAYITEDGTLWAFAQNGEPFVRLNGDKAKYCYDNPYQVAGQVDCLAAKDSCLFYLKTDGTLWKCGSGIIYNGLAIREPVQIFENVLSPASLARVQVPSSWAVEAALWADGYPDLIEKFEGRWQQNISRAEFAAVVVTMTEQLLGRALSAAPANTFRDSSDPYVLKASLAGIVQGTDPGVFSPDRKLTREELALMIYRAILYVQQETGRTLLPNAADLSAFSDREQVSGWAAEAMGALVANKFLNGTGGGLISPKGPATIEQALLIALRVTQ